MTTNPAKLTNVLQQRVALDILYKSNLLSSSCALRDNVGAAWLLAQKLFDVTVVPAEYVARNCTSSVECVRDAERDFCLLAC